MAYLKTAATNWNTLIDALVTFATANGWSTQYNVNGADGRQVGLYTANVKVAIGVDKIAYPVVRGDAGQTDAAISLVPVNAFTAAENYWSHGGDVTTHNSSMRVSCNDLVGPLNDVHFFSGPDYIFAAVRSSPARWTHFGFGAVLRDGGVKVPFAVGQRHAWWIDNVTNGQDRFDIAHAFMFGAVNQSGILGQGAKIQLPNGVLNPAHGFPAGALSLNQNIPVDDVTLLAQVKLLRTDPGINDFDDPSTILSPLFDANFTQTTGGVPLWPLPMIAINKAKTASAFLGELPCIRLFRSTEFSPGDQINYGAESYLVFPVKQRGDRGNTSWGGMANGQPNTLDLFYAYKLDA